jgi:hypothetical protein
MEQLRFTGYPNTAAAVAAAVGRATTSSDRGASNLNAFKSLTLF